MYPISVSDLNCCNKTFNKYLYSRFLKTVISLLHVVSDLLILLELT